MKKRLLAIILALSFIVSVCPVALAEESPYADRFYTVQQFIYAIGAENLEPGQPGDYTDWGSVKDEDKEILQIATANGLLGGYEDGSLRPYNNILRVEALVILSRALPDLTPTEQVINFTDTPDWATEHIDRLSSAGLVKGIGDGLLGANDYITKEQVGILSERIVNLNSATDTTPDTEIDTTKIKEDYYDAVNANWINSNEIPAGYISWSTMGEMQSKNDAKVEEIILGYANEPEGSVRRKVYDYYLSALDMEKRNADGVKPIQPYIDMINNARKKSDLFEVMGVIAKDLSMFSLFPVQYGSDEFNNEKIIMTISGVDTGMSSYYLNEKEYATPFRENLVTLFTLAGEDTSEMNIRNRVSRVIGFNKKMAALTLSYRQYQNINNRYNEYSMVSFRNKYPAIDLKTYFEAMEVPIPDHFIVEEEAQMYELNQYFHFEDIDILKDYLKATLYTDAAPFLSEGFVEAMSTFNSAFYEVSGEAPETDNKNDSALALTDSVFGMVIGVDYLDKYYDASTTGYINDLTKELIATYKERIKGLDWLSNYTKEAAIKKLDTMKIKIGGTQSYADYYYSANILSPDNGGGLMENTASLSKAIFDYRKATLDKPAKRDEWHTPAHTVNAFYSPLNNEIVLPAGILQAPLYSPTASYEENLGAIGSIIAHELTHAFDSSGSHYDETGNYKTWWLNQDSITFEKLSRKVIDRYDSIEVAEDEFVNGEFTLNENIADLGAMACIIDTAAKHENFDYDKMFRSYANSWAQLISDKNLITTLTTDDHSPAKVRVNAVLQNFEKFYETYGITENDGMYLSPEERVHIW